MIYKSDYNFIQDFGQRPEGTNSYPFFFHCGVDVYSGDNNVVFSPVSGYIELVTWRGNDPSSGGFLVRIINDMCVSIGHLTEVFVEANKTINLGDPIGREGKPFNHIHIEYRDIKYNGAGYGYESYTKQYYDPKLFIHSLNKYKPKYETNMTHNHQQIYNDFYDLKSLFSEYAMTGSPHLVEAAKIKGLLKEEDLKKWLSAPHRRGIIHEIYNFKGKVLSDSEMAKYDQKLQLPIDVIREIQN